MKSTDPKTPPLLSANAIARRLKRSPQGVLSAIARLGIHPHLTLESGRYYTEAVVNQIESGMRRKNGESKEG